MAEADHHYRHILRANPCHADSWHFLGVIAYQLGRLDLAIALIGRAIRLTATHAAYHCNLGNALVDLRRLGTAITAYRTALSLTPDVAGFYCNLGNALHDAGRPAEAIAAYGAALRLKPDYAEAHSSLGIALLLTGQFETGWTEFEWRWRTKGFPMPRRTLSRPIWRGETLKNKVILLHAEQGLGDTIQFCRYAPMVAAEAGRVILQTHRPLVRLFERLAGVDHLLAMEDPTPEFDLHCPLMSLPGLLGSRSTEIPPAPPFALDDDLVTGWQNRLGSGQARIGIVWQGNPEHKQDRDRSVPLSLFAPLAMIAGVHLIALQKGFGVEQIEHFPRGLRLSRLGPDYEAGDFLETASVLAALDLVITIDSAVAHLAGSLGVPVWVALPFVPDWRWMLRRDDSPWYPSMRLFRQSSPGAWQDVFERIADALESR